MSFDRYFKKRDKQKDRGWHEGYQNYLGDPPPDSIPEPRARSTRHRPMDDDTDNECA